MVVLHFRSHTTENLRENANARGWSWYLISARAKLCTISHFLTVHFSCVSSLSPNMSRPSSWGIDYTDDSLVAPLYSKCLFFWRHLNAAQDKLGDLCRDAQPWRRASYEISWGNNNRKAGGWRLRAEKSLGQLCLDFILKSVRFKPKPRPIGSAAASRHLLRTLRRWIKQAARGGSKRRRRMWQGRGPVRRPQVICALWQRRGPPRPPLHSPRVFVRFEWPAEPPAEWHVGQFRNRRKVGTPPAGTLGHMLPVQFLLCTKQSTHLLYILLYSESISCSLFISWCPLSA